MSRKKRLINNTNIPQYAIESIARCFLPSILEFYQSEKGQQEFAEWKAQRAAAQAAIKMKKQKTGAAITSAAPVSYLRGFFSQAFLCVIFR